MTDPIHRRTGFTLLEVMLVLVIIVLIAGLVAPSLFGMKERANVDAARAQVHAFHEACDSFRLHMNDYPASLTQLMDGRDQGTKWAGPYIDRIPVDPWGHEYVYEFQQGGKPRIYSLGRDGQPNTADDVHEEEAL